MHRLIIILCGLGAAAFIGCQSASRSMYPPSLEEKKKRLESLRQDLLKLQTQIAELEQAIQAEDSTFSVSRRVPVGYVILKPKPFASYLQFQGSVDNRQVVTLTAKILAPVTRIYVQEGQMVAAGQLLLEQEAEVLRKNLAELRTRLELARTLYEKQKKLYEEGIGSEVQYLTAKNNKESLEASIAAVEEQLRNAQLRAPFAGQIDAIFARVGELLSPGVPAIRLISAGQWEVKAEIPESFLSLAAVGQEVEVFIPDLNLSFRSRLSAVSKNINPLSRTLTAIVREIPPQAATLLRPNLIAYLRLPQSRSYNALVVPIDAIQFQDTIAYVFVVKGHIAKRTRVKVLATDSGEAAISGGVKEGDTIATTGAALLNEGQPVQLVGEGI
ncbi:MAG: efflux RND transporter periplasmic adaptor subunit [Bacteroidia bacterium]|nr:efflux RND transporter periplasmic adaptor subunit [Bacteroidia bacterium]